MADPLDQYDDTFKAAGQEWNVNWRALKAIARQESNGDPNAVSKAGAVGLMQIMPDTGAKLGMTNLRDPTQSIYGAAKYMNEALTAEKDNPAAALLYYHGGPGWRGAYGKESANYVPAVAAHYQRYAKTDTGTATDAKPAPAEATPVAQPQKKQQDDDPFTRALNAPASTETAPAAAPKAAEPDAFTKALGPPQAQETAKPPQSTDQAIVGTVSAEAVPSLVTPEGVGRILQAGKEGWEGVTLPRVPSQYVTAPIYNPLLAGAETMLGAGSAILRGGQQTVQEVLTPLNPQLARDVAALPEAFPFGAGNLRPPVRPPIPEAPPVRRFAGETPVTPAERAANAEVLAATPDYAPGVNPLSPEAAARSAAAVAERPGPAPSSQTGVEPLPVPEGQPPSGRAAVPGQKTQATGAQVTQSYESIHTPAEEAAYRANAEGQKLMEGQKLGEPDLNQYIPGETVNNAQREQTAKAARELKELGIRVPEASQLEKLAEESNDTARKVYAQNTSKGPVEISNRRTQRETDIKADKAQVFAPENVTGPVDFEPVIRQMEKVLNEPENRQNSALQSVYREQLERIRSANIEDPLEAWGLRRDLDRLTDKRMAAKDPNLHYVAHHLDEAANLIDTQIEKVAPGYSDMLARYKEHSRAINEMEVLQGALDKLRGAGQRLTYNDFQRFMKNVVDSRMTPSTDLNAFKAISDENMQRLWNIRDSLRRAASAKELAAAAGSDTMPNIIDALKAVGKMGGSAALHAYVGTHLGPGGNLALQSLGAIGKSLNDRRMIRRATRQMNRLLRPDEPLRIPPGQENPLSPP